MRIINCLTLVYITLQFFAWPYNLVAEEEPRLGRMADGRAYRTDDQGMQLVDQLAELELSVEEFRRRVNGLEYELEEKDNIISALKRNSGRMPSIVEKDLLGSAKVKELANTEPANTETRQLKSNEIQINNKNLAFLQEENKLLKQRLIEQQELTNTARRATLAIQNSQVKESHTNSQSNQQIFELQNKFKKSEQEQTAISSELIDLKTEISRNQNSSGIEQAKYTENMTALELNNQKLLAEVGVLKEQLANQQKTQAVLPDQSARASLSTVSPTRLNALRSELRSLYGRVRGLASERDKRLALQKQASGAQKLKVPMNTLRSSRNMTLAQVNQQIGNVNSEKGVANLRSDLNEIGLLIKEDLQLLERLAR